MKKSFKSLIIFSSLLFASSFTVVSCGNSTPYVLDFDFSPELSVRRTTIFTDENPTIVLNTNKKVETNFSFYLEDDADEEYLEVSRKGVITPHKETPGNKTVGVVIYESNNDLYRTLYLTVRQRSEKSDGGFNYSFDEKKRTDILGELESFAMKNFLTGISLFENGGYMRFSPRFTTGASEYVTGYGFGTLTEGTVVESQKDWLDDSITTWRNYYRSASSSDPLDINAWMATGSQVASLNGYISSSYYGTKLASNKTSYEWYPVLADDAHPEPVAVLKNKDTGALTELSTEASSSGSYKIWRVYLKTGDDNNGVVYHTAENSNDADGKESTKVTPSAATRAFDGQPITLDDYEFIFKMLLTGATKLKRGAELATDTSYGFKGAYSYYKKTESYTGAKASDYEEIEEAWNDFKNNPKSGGGLRTSKDIEGESYTGTPYLQFEFINPLDQFNAKYNLSSNLYSPLPEAFMTQIGGAKGWIAGATNFGRFNDKDIVNRILCVGPYHLETWNKLSETVFKVNDDWFEVKQGRYQIPGVHIKIYTDATQSTEALFNHFKRHELDSTSVPSTQTPLGTDKLAKGDSTFKLNVNSCDKDRWEELFGDDGSLEVAPVTPKWQVNPLMTNYNFLKGLWWSINRKEFAEKRGTTASYNYFADSYLNDPQGKISTQPNRSYNSTDAHKKALTDFGVELDSEDENVYKYGFSESKAIKCFKTAIAELLADPNSGVKQGTQSNPKVYTIRIEWMNPTDKSEYGEDIERYFKKTFNDLSVCGGTIKIAVSHHNEEQWSQVYEEHLMKGKYDLGFGAISGNSLNPLNFMEVLKSDNSSGFTLNWGADTGKIDEANPIVYDGKEWTYDSLWAAGDHGAVVKDAEQKDIVTYGYIDTIKKIDGTSGIVENFENQGGGIMTIPFSFIEFGQGSSATIDHIQLYLKGAGSFDISEEQIRYLDASGNVVTDKDPKKIKFIEITITLAMAQEINNQIFTRNRSLQQQYDNLSEAEKLDPAKTDPIKKKMTRNNYYSIASDAEWWWAIEVYYDINIEGSDPTQTSYDVLKSKDEQDIKKKGMSYKRL